jgi:hypothetical protein
MRRWAITAVAICLAGSAAAADGPVGPSVAGYGVYAPAPYYSPRIEPMIVYDYEPGVIVRSYWWAPWQNRHYFPKTGKRPKVGRLEHMPPRKNSKAEDYFRAWSVSSVFAPQLPPPPMRPYALESAPSLAQPK